MQCSGCGSPISAEDHFCESCGAQVNTPAPAGDSPPPSQAEAPQASPEPPEAAPAPPAQPQAPAGSSAQPMTPPPQPATATPVMDGVKDKASGMAIGVLILGIVGVLGACCCGVLGSIGGSLFGITALIMGFIEIGNIKKGVSSERGKGLVIAGMILGGLTLLVAVLYVLGFSALALTKGL